MLGEEHDLTNLEQNFLEYQDGALSLFVRVDQAHDTVWLTQRQMASLFEVSADNISLHIRNIFRSGELEEAATAEESSVVQHEGRRKVRRQIKQYNLDVILSVGYRVNSKRGIAFRQWASRVIREHIIQGYTENQQRLQQLGQTLQIMQRVQHKLQASQVLDVIRRYEPALTLLDDYDRKRIATAIFLHYLKRRSDQQIGG